MLGFYGRLWAWSIAVTAVLLTLICVALMPLIGPVGAQILSGVAAMLGVCIGLRMALPHLPHQ
ncbi:hypothetical protein [Actinomadura sp. 21ATH]|uniref:hypothetical protein n=1 Tax=Actinomadura sp. 21ATH TaxID=1735444 RepID=UPI0035C0B787